jgi:hypothetical protein
MTTRHVSLLFLLSAPALALFGCGSGSSTNTGTTGGSQGGSNGGSGGSTSGSTGGTTGTGGSSSTASVVKCIDIADDLIADFKTDNGLNPVDGREGGFYVYGDGSIKGEFDPPLVSGEAYPIDTKTGNDKCSGPGSFRVKATGWGVWGSAMGVDFMPKDGTFKGNYDASKYKGVSFWAKATAPLTRVQVSFPDIYTDGAGNLSALDSSLSPCVYSAGATNCSPYLVKFGDSQFPKYQDYQIDTTWKRFDVLFADTRQDQYNRGSHAAATPDETNIDVKHLTAMAIQVNAKFSASSVDPNDYEIWVDDIYFIK